MHLVQNVPCAAEAGAQPSTTLETFIFLGILNIPGQCGAPGAGRTGRGISSAPWGGVYSTQCKSSMQIEPLLGKHEPEDHSEVPACCTVTFRIIPRDALDFRILYNLQPTQTHLQLVIRGVKAPVFRIGLCACK